MKEEIIEQKIVEPIVYQKQENENGKYIGKDGKRYEIITCHKTESKEYRQIGTKIEIIDGQEIEVPIIESYIAINKGWDKFDSLEEALKSYNLEEIENGNN